MVAQLPEDLVHLERGQNRLDQHRGLDRAVLQPQLALRGHEHVVPEPGFVVALQLGQVKVRPGSPLQERPRIMKEVEAKVEECAETDSPSITRCFSGKCQPRGRTIKTAVSLLRAYCLPSGLTYAIDRALRRAD